METGIYSCYIATIIPSEEYATKNRTKIDKMCYSGDPNSEFSGTIVYSTVTTNYTISVESISMEYCMTKGLCIMLVPISMHILMRCLNFCALHVLQEL